MDDGDMTDTFLNTPAEKSVILLRYLQYVRYILLHLQKCSYSIAIPEAKKIFHLYQGVQRARHEMVNILINDAKEIR